MDLLNECYGTQYIVEFGTVLSFSIFSVFGCTHYFLKSANDLKTWATFIINIPWNILYLYFVVMIIILSHLLQKEGEETGVLVQKLKHCDVDRKKVIHSILFYYE